MEFGISTQKTQKTKESLHFKNVSQIRIKLKNKYLIPLINKERTYF